MRYAGVHRGLKGWLCPACGGAHSPDTQSCPQSIPPPSVFPHVPVQNPGMCDGCRKSMANNGFATCNCVGVRRDMSG